MVANRIQRGASHGAFGGHYLFALALPSLAATGQPDAFRASAGFVGHCYVTER